MPTILGPRHQTKLSAASLEAWRGIDTTILSDITGGVFICDPAIRPLSAGARLCGQALTVRCDPGDSGAVIHGIESASAGDVIVVSASASPQYAAMGDLFAATARVAGVAGVLIDGAVRDVCTLRTWDDFPVWAGHIASRGSPGKSGGETNCPIAFGGQVVKPGDLILADDDGIAVIPLHKAEELLPIAIERTQFEARCAAAIRKGEKATALFGLAAPQVAG